MIVKRPVSSIRNISIIGIMLAAGVSACKKFVEIDPPVNEIVSSKVFTSDDMATSAVTGIYGEMMASGSQFSSSGVTFYAGMSADEMTYFSSGFRDEFIRNQITETNHGTLSSNFWERAYRFIYTANLCLEGLAQSEKISRATRNRLIGECKFIRAFCYFHLVNLFGGVPLPTSSDYKVNATLPRAPIDNVYIQIIADLEDARNLLSAEYPTPGRVRPNSWTASALLAKVYLYRKDWNKAEAEATSIINSGAYSLELNLNNVFLRSSNEAIWQLLPVNTIINSTWEGNFIIPESPLVTPTYLLTDTLVKSFEPNDQRKTNWVMARTFGIQTVYYPFKYKIKTAGTLTEYYMVFRLAEQYLIRAEARAHQNKLTEAAEDINIIRNRAGLINTTAVSQTDMLTVVGQERKTELFAEWGNRWYDLKRTDSANTVLRRLKPAWDPTDTLWPIPVSQLKANAALTQNPGY